MRKVMWLIGLLMVANMVVFLMPYKEVNVAHVYEEQENLNSDLLSLLNEEGQLITDSAVTDELVEVIDDEAQQKILANQKVSEITPVKIESKNLLCYRVGPFLQQSSLKLAKAILDNANVQYHESKRESRRAKVYRVYLGPWFDRKQLQSAKQDLRQKKIVDYFEKKQKDDSWIISLGIYLNQASSKNELQRFQSQGLRAGIRNEQQVLPTNYWLNLDFKRRNSNLIKDLSAMDWGGYAAKMITSACN